MNDRVLIFDTTLRDGEQAPGGAMTIPEKIRIAQQLARLNVDIIEAGFPISSPGQYDAVLQITREVEGPVICGLSRALEKDIKAAGDALAGGKKTRIHTFIATSDIHIDAKFSDSRYGSTLSEKKETIIRMTRDAVTYARTFTDDVEFSAEDAGRTDLVYLHDVIMVAVEAGATTINIPDTTGYCTPSEYEKMFTSVREALPDPETIVLSAHCHDDLGLAVANTLAAILAGARQIECTINGIGERAGNASLEEIVMAMHVRSDRLGVTTGIKTPHLMDTSRMVSIATGFPVSPNKAIVGRNAFSHEAGIHQHGVLQRRDTYEIMRAEDVGQLAEQIRLGRHSGRHGFFDRLKKLGIQVPPENQDALYEQFIQLADRKKEIYEQDLLHLVHLGDQVNLNPHFRLENLDVHVGTGHKPEADVTVHFLRTGDTLTHRATGDGPVDSVYRAIDFTVGSAHELFNYSIRSVTEGADAIGEVTVLLSYNSFFFKGVAQHTDVLQASAFAYIDALNHVEAYRLEEEKNGNSSTGN